MPPNTAYKGLLGFWRIFKHYLAIVFFSAPKLSLRRPTITNANL